MSSVARATDRSKTADPPANPLDVVLDALRKKGRRVTPVNAAKFRAQCPAHTDNRASLCVTDVPDDKVLLHCFAGCELASILTALKLAPAQLRHPFVARPPRAVAAIYNYAIAGEVVAMKVRHSDKSFVWRRPDPTTPNGWRLGLSGVKPGLYQPPVPAKSDLVLVVEGEKSVDRLVSLGVRATCPPYGAGGGWKDEWSAELWQGARTVVVLPDADLPGRRHALRVVASLTKSKPVEASVKLIDLPEIRQGEDVFDFLQRYDVEELTTIIDAADPWTQTSSADRKRDQNRIRQQRFRDRTRASRDRVTDPTVPSLTDAVPEPVTLCKVLSIEGSSCKASFSYTQRYALRVEADHEIRELMDARVGAFVGQMPEARAAIPAFVFGAGPSGHTGTCASCGDPLADGKTWGRCEPCRDAATMAVRSAQGA